MEAEKLFQKRSTSMIILSKRVLLFLLVSTLHFEAMAQQNDFGLWLNFNIEKKMTERSSLYLNSLARFQHNASELGTIGSELGYGYKLPRQYSLSLTYRYFSRSRPDRSFSERHRIFIDVSKQKSIFGFTVQGRLRFQYQVRDVLSSDLPWLNASYYLRPMLFVSKRINYHWSVYTMNELFIPLPHLQPSPLQPVDRLMTYVGVNYRLNRHLELIPYYLINMQLNAPNRQTSFIVGLRTDITF